jgi:hypothetical protein
MNDAAFGCADVDALAAELALGIVSGAERAAALDHLAVCGVCRSRVEELSEVADELLLIGPEREPPAGFEGRVIAAMGTASAAPVASTDRPRRRLSTGMWAIAAAIVLIVGAVGVFVGNGLAPGQSPLTKQYVAALNVMGGSALGAEHLRRVPGGEINGEVFAYQGKPSWLFVSVWDSTPEADTVRLIMRGGVPVTVGQLKSVGGSSSLGTDIDVDITKLERVEVVDPYGTVHYQATFTLWWPKWSSSGS